MTNLKKAFQIIQEAEEMAEKKFQKITTEALPRQLAKVPKAEHREEIRRRLELLKQDQPKLKAFYRYGEGQIFEYSPFQFFRVEEQSREALAQQIAAWLLDASHGLFNPLSNTIGATQALAEQYFISRYILYLVKLLDGEPSPPKGKAAPSVEETTFEGLFTSPTVEPLVIRAMQEAEAGPLLNENEACILFGKSTVAPLQALTEVLFTRKLIKEGITKKAAYKAICARFGFEPSDRPDKAKTEREGVYREYLEAFKIFFLNNRPE